ncbi:MAG: biotin attachment protein [Novosphingobium sp.]|nr:lipoyl domain-containing protein [Novosphingobium sp.]MCP5402823.1 biotin attachment protein [Novosphingobium sp.]
MTDIRIADDQWDGDNEGNLLTWIYDDGAEVSAGDIVVEIMVEKLQVEIEAPVSGTLRHARAEGDLVNRGDVIGKVDLA